jgi:16S rRNA (cytosine967-C5)-methyltransferase
MTPAARIQASIEILEKVAASERIPMDGIVGDYMRSRRYIGSKDRADIASRTYNLIRAYARLGWWVAHAKGDDTPRSNVMAFLILQDKADLERLRILFDGSQYGPPALGDADIAFAEKLFGQALDHPDMPADVRAECPPQYAAKLQEYFGDKFTEEMDAMRKSAPLDLRVNMFLSDREKALESLKKDGRIVTDPTPFSPWGLRARGKAHISRSKAFVKGWVEIQDEGSQLIALVCGAEPGMQVLDYCAGGGGKTLALAAAMKRKGRIVAMDTDEKRLAKGKERFKKAQVSDIIEVRPLSDEKQRKWLKRQKDKFDIVLLDVPCSGTGTWRRNPDMRWKTYGPTLETMIATQADILEKASDAVKPGGKLVYATCSLLPEENEKQVEKFLEKHPEFEVQPPDEKLGNPYMRLTPLRHNTDGFFAAVMVKKSA